MGNLFINLFLLFIGFQIKRNPNINRIWYKNHESSDELTNFDKMLITFDRSLLELNSVNF